MSNARFTAARKRSLNKIRRPSHLIEVYETKDAKQPWRWRLWAINTQNVGPGGEAYAKRSMVIRNINAVLGVAFGRDVVPRKGGFVFEVDLLGKIRVTV